MGRRVIENKYPTDIGACHLQGEWAGGSLRTSTRPRLERDLPSGCQGECSTSYRRADSARRFNVGRVLVLDDPPAAAAAVGAGGERDVDVVLLHVVAAQVEVESKT